MAFIWGSHAAEWGLSWSFPSPQSPQKRQNACCLGKCIDRNYTLLIAEDLTTEYLEETYIEQGTHLSKWTSPINQNWAVFVHVKTNHFLMKWLQNRNNDNQVLPNCCRPRASGPTISKQWKPSFKFNSSHCLKITKEGDEINAMEMEKREATAGKNHKLCGPPRQNHPAFLLSQNKRSQATVGKSFSFEVIGVIRMLGLCMCVYLWLSFFPPLKARQWEACGLLFGEN